MSDPLTLVYFPSAVVLGALHALEPGHAKTLTAAYLIGIKGTRRDAILLGLAVAFTHSLVVIGLAALALWIGHAAFTDQAIHWLQIGSGLIVIALGFWMLLRRVAHLRRVRLAQRNVQRRQLRHHHHHDHDHDHDHHHDHDHDHDSLDDDAHARAHAASIPEYAKQGQRPTALQILTFGAAGGLVPCPASVTVMLLALSVGQVGMGIFTVMGFSLGLAITLVTIGLLVVMGVQQLGRSGRFDWLSTQAPILSAAVVILSGLAALLVAAFHR